MRSLEERLDPGWFAALQRLVAATARALRRQRHMRFHSTKNPQTGRG
jgi:hypothetical protein